MSGHCSSADRVLIPAFDASSVKNIISDEPMFTFHRELTEDIGDGVIVLIKMLHEPFCESSDNKTQDKRLPKHFSERTQNESTN